MDNKELTEFHKISQAAQELIRADAMRDAMLAAMRNIFEMRWDRAPRDPQIREMVSPGGHNVVRGMVNIMTGVKPTFNVPYDEGDIESEEKRSMAEKYLATLFNAADDVHGHSLVMDMALSGSLYDLIACKLMRTKDHAALLQQYADEKGDRTSKKRLDKQIAFYDELAETHPFLIDVISPETIHYKRGVGGVLYLVEARRRTIDSLREEFGETACPNRSINDVVTYYEYWDRYQCCKWAEYATEPFLLAEYDTPSFIPYIVTEVNGSDLFGEVQLFPILYAIWRGDIWEAQNMALTMWRSNLYAMGNPTLVAIGPSAHEADIPMHLAGGRINLNPGDSISQLGVNLAPPEMVAFNNLARALEEESTVNKMVFGRAPETLLAYSTVNLLVQGARHSLVALQFAMSRAVTELSRKMLRWIKESGEPVTLFSDKKKLTLRPDDIDQQILLVESGLKPDIPSDRLQMANMAKMLVDSGILSRYSARVLAGYNQPEDEEDKITRERIREIISRSKLAELEQMFAPKPPEEAPSQQTPSAMMGQRAEQQLEAENLAYTRPGFIGQEANVPIVQVLGQPPDEFTQAAANNMSPIETMWLEQ